MLLLDVLVIHAICATFKLSKRWYDRIIVESEVESFDFC